MNKDLPILVVGAGSIGERHIRNLWGAGYRNLFVFRQRNLPFRDVADATPQVITNWNDVAGIQPFAAFICTPSNQHLQQVSNCLEEDMHVFAEKPLSDTSDGLTSLKTLISKKKKLLQVGFMMRFHPFIKKIKQLIEQENCGRLISFQTHWGSYLPDWHPWEDYKTTYAAKKEMGGGVALTLCHDIDLALWLTGSPLKNYTTQLSYEGGLDIDAESIADMHFDFENGVVGKTHLNYLDKPPQRFYRFVFERAQVAFDYFENTLIVDGDTPMIERLDTFDRNDLYVDELQAFFHTIENESDPVAYSLNQVNESERIIKICHG